MRGGTKWKKVGKGKVDNY